MTARQQALGAAAAPAAGGRLPGGHRRPARPAGGRASTDALTATLAHTEIQRRTSAIPGRDIVQVRTEIPAGVASGWHTHPGEEVGYIVAGTVQMEIAGRTTLVLHPGKGCLAGGWAYSFSYAAALSVGIRWLVAEQVGARQTLTYCLLGVISLAVAALAVRTAVGLRRGRFLIRLPAPTAQASMTTALDGLAQHSSTASSDGGSSGAGS